MTDVPRGPTTEELRARALQGGIAQKWADNAAERRETLRQAGATIARAGERQGSTGWLEAARANTNAVLPRPCLACNREQGERMCDLCQRLEDEEANAQ